jgi:hypothetical protein
MEEQQVPSPHALGDGLIDALKKLTQAVKDNTAQQQAAAAALAANTAALQTGAVATMSNTMALGLNTTALGDDALADGVLTNAIDNLIAALGGGGSPVTGIVVIPDTNSSQGRRMMAKMKLTKAPKAAARLKPHTAGTPVTTFNLVDNGNNSYTVVGVDAAGAQVDISGVATLAAVSSDPTVMTVTTNGMSFTVTAATPPPAVGSQATITLTATWNDGSIGPFTATIQGTITGGAVIGIEVV